MYSFEIVAVAPLNRFGAREVTAKNRALPFQRRETLLDRRLLHMQSRRDLIGSRRPTSLERTAHQFGARRFVVASSIVCGGEDLFILADDNSLHRFASQTDARDSPL